jgi:hypothetical protein
LDQCLFLYFTNKRVSNKRVVFRLLNSCWSSIKTKVNKKTKARDKRLIHAKSKRLIHPYLFLEVHRRLLPLQLLLLLVDKKAFEVRD